MISDNIKAIRAELGLSQAEFARRIHVTQGAVSQWEKGLTRPDTDMLMIISTMFDIPLDALVKGEPIVNKMADPVEKLPDDLQELIALYNRCSPESRAKIIGFATGLSVKK